MDTMSDIVAKLNKHKLPEDMRPPMSEIADAVDSRISKKLQSFFVQDCQNDCSCSIETYDIGAEQSILYLDSGEVKEITGAQSCRLELPMLPEMTESSVMKLLEIACSKALNQVDDKWYQNLIYNPNSDVQKVLNLYYRVTGYSPDVNRYGGPKNWLPASFVPLDQVFFTPDVECFGVLAANIGGFGAFCIPDVIMKCPLE